MSVSHNGANSNWLITQNWISPQEIATIYFVIYPRSNKSDGRLGCDEISWNDIYKCSTPLLIQCPGFPLAHPAWACLSSKPLNTPCAQVGPVLAPRGRPIPLIPHTRVRDTLQRLPGSCLGWVLGLGRWLLPTFKFPVLHCSSQFALGKNFPN